MSTAIRGRAASEDALVSAAADLFEEVGPGQLVTVDVENWDGEGAGENAKFTFTGAPKAMTPDSPEDLAEATK